MQNQRESVFERELLERQRQRGPCGCELGRRAFGRGAARARFGCGRASRGVRVRFGLFGLRGGCEGERETSRRPRRRAVTAPLGAEFRRRGSADRHFPGPTMPRLASTFGDLGPASGVFLVPIGRSRGIERWSFRSALNLEVVVTSFAMSEQGPGGYGGGGYGGGQPPGGQGGWGPPPGQPPG